MMVAQKTIFITGATGYIGSVITEFAIADGYAVRGLSRSESGDAKLKALGAAPVRGDLTSLDVIRDESAKADFVLHLATAYVLGQTPSYEDVIDIDSAALDAIAEALEGTDKALVVTSGTLSALPHPDGEETTESSPRNSSPINTRGKVEDKALTLVSRGIRVISIRLAPYVYGRGGSGVKLFMDMGAKNGSIVTVESGKSKTTIVHVDDAARLYLLAAEKGKAGETFNASGGTDVTQGQIAEAIAKEIGVQVKNITVAVAKEQMGEVFAFFLNAENRASGKKAQVELGWQPKGSGILDEITTGSYQGVVKELRKRPA
ncbi:hypothetical protein B0O99DRAFT_116756 [Bisporella sp. PMI_857]|nr:hypothetical protein B0O99DRAFT_116756 [Bisporella sp. PMI_857]